MVTTVAETMIACLPMYDWPENQTFTDQFWCALRDELRGLGVDAPDKLTRDIKDEAMWLAADLLLSQTCGYPLATSLRGKVQYVATPVYWATGCEGATYSSAIIVHRDSGLSMANIAGKSLVISSQNSWSGNKTIVEKFGPLAEYFGRQVESGGHRNSCRMVARGEGDLAAIDAVCWQLIQRFEPETARKLMVVGWTPPRPALPFITSNKTSKGVVAKLRACLAKIMAGSSDLHKSLFLRGCEILKVSDYDEMAQY